MTDQELLEAYKEAKKNEWSCVNSGFDAFARKVNEVKKLEEMIVVRWVNMMQEKEVDN